MHSLISECYIYLFYAACMVVPTALEHLDRREEGGSAGQAEIVGKSLNNGNKKHTKLRD